MAGYRSPSGEVLDIPTEGVRSIVALGWVPVDPPKEEKPKRKPRKEED